jgi:hypothetical protein
LEFTGPQNGTALAHDDEATVEEAGCSIGVAPVDGSYQISQAWCVAFKYIILSLTLPLRNGCNERKTEFTKQAEKYDGWDINRNYDLPILSFLGLTRYVPYARNSTNRKSAQRFILPEVVRCRAVQSPACRNMEQNAAAANHDRMPAPIEQIEPCRISLHSNAFWNRSNNRWASTGSSRWYREHSREAR